MSGEPLVVGEFAANDFAEAVRGSHRRSPCEAEINHLRNAYSALPITSGKVDWQPSSYLESFVEIVHRLHRCGVTLKAQSLALGKSPAWLTHRLTKIGRRPGPRQARPSRRKPPTHRPPDLTAKIVQLRDAGTSWREISQALGISSGAAQNRYKRQVWQGRTIV